MNRESIVVIWDPVVVSPEEYRAMVLAIGDVVRAHGGEGIELIVSRTIVFRQVPQDPADIAANLTAEGT